MKSAIDNDERSAIVKRDFQHDGTTISAGSDGDTVSAGSDGDGGGDGTNVGDRDYVVAVMVVIVTIVRIVTLVTDAIALMIAIIWWGWKWCCKQVEEEAPIIRMRRQGAYF